MSTKARRKVSKPDLEPVISIVVDEKFLSDEAIAILTPHLPSHATAASRAMFFEICSSALHMALAPPTGSTMAEEKKAIALIEKRSRDLLLAIDNLVRNQPIGFRFFEAIADPFLYRNPDTMLPFAAQAFRAHRGAGVLNVVWDHIDSLNATASAVGQELRPSKRSKPSENKARTIANVVVRCYVEAFNVLPAGHQGSEFTALLAAFGEVLDVTIGPRIAAAAAQGAAAMR